MTTREMLPNRSIFLTSVGKEGPFLKIWGQTDKSSSLNVEEALVRSAPRLEEPQYHVNPRNVETGLLCCAKYADMKYYRARVTDTSTLSEGLVGVDFLDYGNSDKVPVMNLRSLECFTPAFIALPPLAIPFILAEVISHTEECNDQLVEQISRDIGYMDAEYAVVAQTPRFSLIKLYIQNADYGLLLLQQNVMNPTVIQTQELILTTMMSRPTYLNRSLEPPPVPQQEQQPLLQYKTVTLEPGITYEVYVSFITDGPSHFSVQLKTWENDLALLMRNINSIQLKPLEELPMPGTVCLAKCAIDNHICRAVVTSEVDTNFKIYYVDFGNTEVVPSDNLYQMPFKYIIPKVMAIRVSLAGVEKSVMTKEMQCSFKQFVDNRLLVMEILPQTKKIALPKCRMWDPTTNTNVIEVLNRAALSSYPSPVVLNRGFTQKVRVSYVYSCSRFYVQLKAHETELTTLMVNLQNYCASHQTPYLGKIKVGQPCCALFDLDGQWYRSMITEICPEGGVKVLYVDFGNEEKVSSGSLKDIDGEYLRVLKPQAIKCCLNGYQNVPEDAEQNAKLEELILEQEFTMKVVGTVNNNTMVELTDDDNKTVGAMLIESTLAQQQPPPETYDNKVNQVYPEKVENETRGKDKKPYYQHDDRSTSRKRNDSNSTESVDSWRKENRGFRNRKGNDWNEGKGRDNKGFGFRSRNEPDEGGRPGRPKPQRQEWRGDESHRNTFKNRNDEWNNRDEGNENRKFRNRDERGNKDDGSDNGGKFSRKPRENRDDSNNWNASGSKDGGSGWNEDKPAMESWGNDKKNFGDQSRERNYRDQNRPPRQRRENREGGDGGASGGWNDNTWSNDATSKTENRAGESDSWQSKPKTEYRNNNRRGGGDSWGNKDGASHNDDRRNTRNQGGSDNWGENQNTNGEWGGQNAKPGNKWGDKKDYGDRNTNSGDWNSNSQRTERKFNDNRERGGFRKPYRKDGGESSSSEKSFSKGPKKSAQPEIPIDSAADDANFEQLDVAGREEKISISWFHNPTRFFCQLVDGQEEFKQLMQTIQETYCGKTPGALVKGAPAICLFPEDKVLYRAKILSVTDDNRYKIYYVDFGNVSTVDKVWPIDKKFMTMPAQAIPCGLSGLQPLSDNWPNPDKFSEYFERSLTCRFFGKEDDRYLVTVTHDDVDLAQKLVDDGLAKYSEESVPNQLDVWMLVNQQFRAMVGAVNNLSDFTLMLRSGGTMNCTMHNLISATETHEDKLKEQEGQILIVYADDYVDGKLEVTLYDSTGTKLSVIAPDEGAFDNVEPLCPYPVASSVLKGFVSHVEEQRVALQPEDCAASINDLLESLYEYYENQTIEHPIVPEEEFNYAVKSSDGNWYRGKVIKFDDEKATVAFCDYGNTEDVDFASLRELTPDFAAWDAMAVTINMVDTPTAELLNKEVTVSIVIDDRGFCGAVMEVTAPPTEEVVIETVAEPAGDVTVTSTKQAVLLSHTDSPNDFYIQLIDSQDDIAALQIRLQEQVETLSPLESASVGALCAAPYMNDWYRSQILDADGEITTVRFVDYGNTDVIVNETTAIKTLPHDMLTLKEYATRCRLMIKPIDEEWSKAATDRFDELTQVDDLSVEFVDQDEKISYVELFSNGANVKDILVDEKLALIDDILPERELTGFVSHVNSPSEFWVQLESCCAELEWIAEQLSSAASFSDLDDLTPGALCAAMFADDEMWYRARILSNTIAGLEVLFLDYGNACISSNLKQLPEHLVMAAPLALKCSLQRPKGMIGWSAESSQKFSELCADGQTVFVIKKLTTGETSTVELSIDGEDVVAKLLPVTDNGYVTDIESLESFSISEKDDKYKLEQISGMRNDDESLRKFVEICDEGKTCFDIEYLTDNFVRLYLNGCDIRNTLRDIGESQNTEVQTATEQNGELEVEQRLVNDKEVTESSVPSTNEIDDSNLTAKIDVEEATELHCVEPQTSDESTEAVEANATKQNGEVTETAEPHCVELQTSDESNEIIEVNTTEPNDEVIETSEHRCVEFLGSNVLVNETERTDENDANVPTETIDNVTSISEENDTADNIPKNEESESSTSTLNVSQSDTDETINPSDESLEETKATPSEISDTISEELTKIENEVTEIKKDEADHLGNDEIPVSSTVDNSRIPSEAKIETSDGVSNETKTDEEVTEKPKITFQETLLASFEAPTTRLPSEPSSPKKD